MRPSFEEYFFDILTTKKPPNLWKQGAFQVLYDTYHAQRPTWTKAKHTAIQHKYTTFLHALKRKYPHLRKLQHPKLEALIVRYGLIHAFSNVSLSVPQENKAQLMRHFGIRHEMFGSFFNTHPDMTYCCIFPDIEGLRCKSDFFAFDPAPAGAYLVNPPYETAYITETIRRILKWLASGKSFRFFVVVPVWDTYTRAQLGLSTAYGDLPAITQLRKSPHCVFHRVMHLPFYDGTHNKQTHLKDPVHVFLLQAGLRYKEWTPSKTAKLQQILQI